MQEFNLKEVGAHAAATWAENKPLGQAVISTEINIFWTSASESGIRNMLACERKKPIHVLTPLGCDNWLWRLLFNHFVSPI